jgi:hypothetical protein
MEGPADHKLIREPTEAWLATLDLVGRSEEALTSAADQQGLQVRVISRDGQMLALHADYRPDRVNVEVVGALITRVDGVY